MKSTLSAGRALAPALAILLGACAKPPMTLPGPLDFPRSPQAQAATISEAAAPRPTPETTVAVMPTPVLRGVAPPAPPPAVPPGAADSEEVSMAIEQTPLPMFIQILYGNVLKRPYSVDPAINARNDVVTFKTSRPLSRARLSEIAVQLLASYQIAVQDLDGLIRIIPANVPGASAASPTLRFGKTLPQTPEALRTAFHFVELDVVRVAEMTPILRQVLGNRVTYQEDAARNGLLLSGTQNDLRIALDLIRSLDQPRLRGTIARRLTPAYLNAAEFSGRLIEVLSAQGYAVGTGAASNTPIVLIPIPVIGSVMAFASTESAMELVLRWARELDRPIIAQTQNGLYTYPVKYADAQDLARTLSEVLGSSALPAAQPAAAPGAPAIGSSTVQPRPSGSSNRVVVNSATNTLIIRGTNADEYQQIQSLLRELDRPVKSALIEVVVAELRLGGSQVLGIEWNVPTRSINSGQNLITGGTLGRLGLGTSGFSLSYGNAAGQILAQLNALASNNQARILSNPKVMSRNGETASIQVGQEVPVVTSQQSASTGGVFGGTAVLNQISYRSTGVILRVRPVINSGNRLDLDVSQEVSSAAETRTGVSASPTISTRRIETKLSLRDGSTVLLGGLISRTASDADTGIPWLKDMPGIGALFRTQSDLNDQTELLIMITPYVINDDFEAEAITEAIQKSFGGWAQDLRPARVVAPVTAPVPAVPAPERAPSGPTPPRTPEVPISELVPPLPAVRSAPAPVEAVAPSAPVPAPAAAPAPAADSGVTMSRPAGAAPAPSPAPAPAPAPAGAAAPPAPAGTPVPPAGGSMPPGTPVADPEVKRQIEELLRGGAPRRP